MNTSDPHQIEKKELFSPTISDEQICAKFREGENIYNITSVPLKSGRVIN